MTMLEIHPPAPTPEERATAYRNHQRIADELRTLIGPVLRELSKH